MNKLSKAYNHATAELDALVRETRRIHHEAVDALEAARAENSKWSRPIPEFDYKGKAAQAQARANFDGAKKSCFATVTAAWDSFDQEAAAIRAKLVDALADAGIMRAADLDPRAVALLDSGLMTSRDYAQMARDYSENSAILSKLRQSAARYADSLHDEFGGEGKANEIYAVRHVIESA